MGPLGKIDISSFSLSRIPPEVYTRLIGIPESDLSNPPSTNPKPYMQSTKTASMDSPSARTWENNRWVADSAQSKEAVFGLALRDIDWGEAAELTVLSARDNEILEVEREIGVFGGVRNVDVSGSYFQSSSSIDTDTDK